MIRVHAGMIFGVEQWPAGSEIPLSDEKKVTANDAGAPNALARRFADDEVARILKGAAELQERSSSNYGETGRGLTLEELRQIAEEAGIDPRFVDQAANRIASPDPTEASVFIGAPTEWHFAQSVDGTLEEADFQRILMTLRSTMKQRGDLTEVFGRMEWSYDDGLGPVIVGITSQDGTTDIDVTTARSGEAGLYYGLCIPFAGIFGGAVLSSLLAMKGAAALPLVALAGGASYVATRFLWKSRARWWEKRLRDVTEKIAEAVRNAASLQGGAASSDRALSSGEPSGDSDER